MVFPADAAGPVRPNQDAPGSGMHLEPPSGLVRLDDIRQDDPYCHVISGSPNADPIKLLCGNLLRADHSAVSIPDRHKVTCPSCLAILRRMDATRQLPATPTLA